MIEKQEIYDEFVLSYILTHPRCSQLDIFNGLRNLYVNVIGEDPGIQVLGLSIERLMEEGKITTTTRSARGLFLAS